ncbi:MAG: precorrin-8X methylmutase [Candidatus Hodgkinia cicadicola]
MQTSFAVSPIRLRTNFTIKHISSFATKVPYRTLLSQLTRNIASRLYHSCGFNVFKFCSFTDGAFVVLKLSIKRNSVVFSDTRALQQLLSSPSTKHLVVCISEVLKVRSLIQIIDLTSASAQADVLSKTNQHLERNNYVLVLGTSPTFALRTLELAQSANLYPSVSIICPLGLVNGEACKLHFTRAKLHCCIVRACFGGLALAAAMINASSL